MPPTDNISPQIGVIGAISGFAAALLGYLVVYITQRGRIEERLQLFNVIADLFGSDPIPAWQGVGWLFYNAHFVNTEIPGFGGTRVENFIAAADGGSLTLLYLVPPLLLLAAGFVTAAIAAVDSPTDGGIIGILVTLGYLPVAIGGSVLFAYAIGGGTIRPDPITAVLLAGVMYPVAFGGLGGVIAGTSFGKHNSS